MKSKNMKKLKTEYTSYEEYQHDVYGKSTSEQLLSLEDPRVFGIRLARESLSKVKQILKT